MTARSDILAAAFSLAALAALAAYADTGRRALLVALPLAALAAFGSKESALLVGVPLIALGLERRLAPRRLAPALPDHLPVIAQAELELGHPERAAQVLERLLSPGFAENPYAIQQRLDFGNDFMSRFDRAAAWHLMGRARWAEGRRAEADAAFSEAAHLATGRPNEAAYLVDLSSSLRASGKFDEARVALERAAALRPDWDRPGRERRALDAGSVRTALPENRDPKER